MTREEFESLVNLYLDGEIEPDDFHDLMEEVERDPQRRRAFNEHCRLHSAVQMALFSRRLSPETRQVGDAAAEPSVRLNQLERSRAITEVVRAARKQSRRRRKLVRVQQGLAAAACFGLLLVVGVAGSWDKWPEAAQSWVAEKTQSILGDGPITPFDGDGTFADLRPASEELTPAQKRAAELAEWRLDALGLNNDFDPAGLVFTAEGPEAFLSQPLGTPTRSLREPFGPRGPVFLQAPSRAGQWADFRAPVPNRTDWARAESPTLSTTGAVPTGAGYFFNLAGANR